MSGEIAFEVPGAPVGQPRQRHRVVTSGGRSFATNYTPRNDPVQGYKAAVQLAARNAMNGGPLFEGPVELAATFVLPRPKALCWKRRPTPRQPAARKPDADNLLKALLDALRGVVYGDDAQVYAVRLVRLYAAGGEPPATFVMARSITATEVNADAP